MAYILFPQIKSRLPYTFYLFAVGRLDDNLFFKLCSDLRYFFFFLIYNNNSTLRSSGRHLAKTAIFSRIIILYYIHKGTSFWSQATLLESATPHYNCRVS